MNLKLWQKRERLSEIIFTITLVISVGFTFVYDFIDIQKNILFIVLGLLESTLLVLLFSRTMNIIEMKKNKEEIKIPKIISLLLYTIMFIMLGYYFVLLG